MFKLTGFKNGMAVKQKTCTIEALYEVIMGHKFSYVQFHIFNMNVNVEMALEEASRRFFHNFL